MVERNKDAVGRREAATRGRAHRAPHYVIHAPRYTSEWGGIMALYGLADALNAIGADAYVWPADVRFEAPVGRLEHLRVWMDRKLLSLHRMLRPARRRLQAVTERAVSTATSKATGPGAVAPPSSMRLATRAHLKEAVVVYPEVVNGNPLGAERVVRWFLNKPGRLTGRIEYGRGELYFYHQEIFNDPQLNPDADSQLTIVTVLSDIYRRYNFGPRTGTCYILRKGWSRVPDPSQLDGPVIDGKSHEEIARLFNECEYCVSYDLHTLFSSYAAVCGCKSIVVPEPGLSREQWQPREELTYGIAYGMDDLDRAERTKSKIHLVLKRHEENNLASAEFFRRRCESFFFGNG